MARTFVEMTLERIDEGRLIADAAEALAKAQRDLAAYCARWSKGLSGPAAVKGATASVVIKITMRCDNPEERVFSVKGQVDIREPHRPARVTVALASQGEGGEEVLMCRPGGTAADIPNQGRLFTEDGRVTVETKEER